MKLSGKLFLIVNFLFYSNLLFAQNELVNIISKDSLTQYVKELTGAVPVIVDGKVDTIKTRAVLTTGNRLAAKYIYDKMHFRGTATKMQHFHGRTTLNPC